MGCDFDCVGVNALAVQRNTPASSFALEFNDSARAVEEHFTFHGLGLGAGRKTVSALYPGEQFMECGPVDRGGIPVSSATARLAQRPAKGFFGTGAGAKTEAAEGGA